MEQNVVTVSLTGQVAVWSTGNGTVLHSFATATGATGLGAGVLDPDALLLPTPNKAKGSNLEIWSLRRGKQLSKSILRDRIITVQVSPDGLFAVGGSSTGQLYCWDVSTGRLLQVWKAHYHGITALCFAGNDFIVSGAKDNMIRVWGMEGVVRLLRIREDGTYSGISMSESAPNPFCEWTDHALPVTHLSSTGGGVNGRVVSASADGTARIWDIPNKSLVYSFDLQTPLQAAVIDPTGTWLYAAGQDAKIHRILLLESSRSGPAAFRDTPGLLGHNAAVISLDLSADGSRLVSGSMDGSARLWDTRSGQTIRILRPSGAGDPSSGKQRVSSGCYALFTPGVAHQPPASLSMPLGSSQQVDPLSSVARREYPRLAPTVQSLGVGSQRWIGPLWLENVELPPIRSSAEASTRGRQDGSLEFFLDSKAIRESQQEDLLDSLADEAVFEHFLSERRRQAGSGRGASSVDSDSTPPSFSGPGKEDADELRAQLADLQKKYDRLKTLCVGQLLQEGAEDEVSHAGADRNRKKRRNR